MGTIDSTAIVMWEVVAILFEGYCASGCFAIGFLFLALNLGPCGKTCILKS